MWESESSSGFACEYSDMPTAIHRRVEQLRANRDPTLIARLPSGWAVFGERQFLHGYALLLPDPVVPDLNVLTGDAPPVGSFWPT
jgi:hypothetical protein